MSELLAAYDVALTSDAAAPPLPKPIATLCERAARRTRKELLDMRAPSKNGKRAFDRGSRYLELDEPERAALPASGSTPRWPRCPRIRIPSSSASTPSS